MQLFILEEECPECHTQNQFKNVHGFKTCVNCGYTECRSEPPIVKNMARTTEIEKRFVMNAIFKDNLMYAKQLKDYLQNIKLVVRNRYIIDYSDYINQLIEVIVNNTELKSKRIYITTNNALTLLLFAIYRYRYLNNPQKSVDDYLSFVDINLISGGSMRAISNHQKKLIELIQIKIFGESIN